MTLPHPINFGLHKMIVSSRRKNIEKKAKDIEAGLEVLRLCIDNMNEPKLVGLFKNISQKQQKKIIKTLKDNDAKDISRILN